MLFQKFTLGLKMHLEPVHSLKHHPSGKPGDCSMGCLGLWSAQADALMAQTERIKSIQGQERKLIPGNINGYVTRPTEQSKNNTRSYRSDIPKTWAFPKLARDGGPGDTRRDP